MQAVLAVNGDVATHKKILHITASRSLPRQVPRQFPFVSINWGFEYNVGKVAATGLAYVLEDEINVGDFGASPLDFSIDAVGSALGEELPQLLRLRSKSSSVAANEVNIHMHVFQRDWVSFDWRKSSTSKGIKS